MLSADALSVVCSFVASLDDALNLRCVSRMWRSVVQRHAAFVELAPGGGGGDARAARRLFGPCWCPQVRHVCDPQQLLLLGRVNQPAAGADVVAVVAARVILGNVASDHYDSDGRTAVFDRFSLERDVPPLGALGVAAAELRHFSFAATPRGALSLARGITRTDSLLRRLTLLDCSVAAEHIVLLLRRCRGLDCLVVEQSQPIVAGRWRPRRGGGGGGGGVVRAAALDELPSSGVDSGHDSPSASARAAEAAEAAAAAAAATGDGGSGGGGGARLVLRADIAASDLAAVLSASKSVTGVDVRCLLLHHESEWEALRSERGSSLETLRSLHLRGFAWPQGSRNAVSLELRLANAFPALTSLEVVGCPSVTALAGAPRHPLRWLCLRRTVLHCRGRVVLPAARVAVSRSCVAAAPLELQCVVLDVAFPEVDAEADAPGGGGRFRVVRVAPSED